MAVGMRDSMIWEDIFICAPMDLEAEAFPIFVAADACPRASLLSHFSDFVPRDEVEYASKDQKKLRQLSPNASCKTRPRAVSFSRFAEGTFIPEDEPTEKWYTAEEEVQLRLSRLEDVRRLLREIHDAPSNAAIAQDQILHCCGIEDFVTEGLAEHIDETRMTHVKAVLHEQDLQRQRGINDPVRLSKISRMRSRWTRERAQRIATGYSTFLTD